MRHGKHSSQRMYHVTPAPATSVVLCGELVQVAVKEPVRSEAQLLLGITISVDIRIVESVAGRKLERRWNDG